MKRRMLLVSGLVAVIGLSLLYVRSRFLLVELSYQVEQKRQKKAQLEENRRALSVELSTLRSPQRIARLARERIGLTKTVSGVSVVIMDETGLKNGVEP